MYKVLVCDDEPPITRNVMATIEKCNSNFKVTHIAYDGREAAEALNHSEIDVIFVDMNMPVLDGSELMHYIKSEFPEIVMIVLSGYQQFEYARAALVNGAFDYLLKPLNINDISKVLRRVEQHLKNRYLNKIKKFFHDVSYLKQNSFIPLMDAEEKPIGYIADVCMGSLVSHFYNSLSSIENLWDKVNLSQICEKYSQINETLFSCKINSCEQFVFSISHNGEYNFESIRQIFLKLKKEVKAPVNIFYIPVNYIENFDLVSVISDLRNVMRKNIIFEHSEIVISDRIGQRPNFALSSTDENKLTTVLRYAESKEIKDFIHFILQKAKSQNASQIALKNTLVYVLSLAQKYLPISNFKYTVISDIVDETLVNSLNYDELEENFLYYFSKMKNEPSKISGQCLSEKLKKYIDAHFAESLTNTELSAVFCLSPAYMSKLFRLEKGISPLDYLSEVRIKHAKEMLISYPDMLIKNIASAVGYQDPLYFSRVFKKATGLTTTEYRARRQSDF